MLVEHVFNLPHAINTTATMASIINILPSARNRQRVCVRVAPQQLKVSVKVKVLLSSFHFKNLHQKYIFHYGENDPLGGIGIIFSHIHRVVTTIYPE